MSGNGDPADTSERLRTRAAWMYFVEGMTQNEVAQHLGLSRVATVRLIADARRRREVRFTIKAPHSDLAGVERELEEALGIDEVVLAPLSSPDADPTQVIAAAAGALITDSMHSNMTVGVGWGRTLYTSLPYITGRTLENFKVVSLLGGIAQARRFNPAEFAWQFAELFQGEGFLVPAPAVVDSPDTKHALLERCGIAQIFEMADSLDTALISVGGITTLTTSYRVGHLSEADRLSLMDAGAVGDILYNFIDVDGNVVDHPVNRRAISVTMEQLRRAPRCILASGGKDKVNVLNGCIKLVEPNVLVSDEHTGRALLERSRQV